MLAAGPHSFLPSCARTPRTRSRIHKLLVRGGYIRQVGAGLWTYLPLGWRVHRKVEQIIREEMDAIGAQEILPRAHAGRALGDDRPRSGSRDLPRSPTATAASSAADDPRGDGHLPRARDQSYRELPQSGTTSGKAATSRARAAGCCGCASSS